MQLIFTAGLLAGGKSSRMGRDKACVEFAGVPLWRLQLATLAALAPMETLISGRPAAMYSASGCEIVEDEIREAGPLAGVAALLARARAPLLLVLAVDMPHMTSACLEGVLKRCTSEVGTVPKCGGFYEPLAAVFPKAALPLAQAVLSSGAPSMQQFVRDCIAARLVKENLVAEPDAFLFKSVNEPADLQHK